MVTLSIFNHQHHYFREWLRKERWQVLLRQNWNEFIDKWLDLVGDYNRLITTKTRHMCGQFKNDNCISILSK
jgi:hypothetical protein